MRPSGRRPHHLVWIALLVVVVTAATGCGRGRPLEAATEPPQRATVVPTPRPTAAPTLTATAAATTASTPAPATPPPGTPAPTSTPTPAASAPGTLPPNELGRVLILEYHHIGTPESQFVRSPQHLRDDLQWLYDHDFVTIPLIDYLTNDIHAPAGKRPVVLTFDDGTESQFRYLVGPDGTTRPDPNSAVPILMAFGRTHPGFGHYATFFLLPYGPFGRTLAQLAYAQQKLDFLVANGFSIGNHTLDHTDLSRVSAAVATEELAKAVQRLHHYLPTYEPHVVALPFGGYPPSGPAVLRQGTYDGTTYNNVGAMLVGAQPAPSPASTHFDPMRTPRVQAWGPVLAAWFGTIEKHPDEFYVSDGNPQTITVPRNAPASLGKLDTARLAAEGRAVVRY